MALFDRYRDLRDLLNSQHLYRVLEDNDVLQAGDETVRASMLESGSEEWHAMDHEFENFFGRTVEDMNSEKFNKEMDVKERLFRRRRAQPSKHKDEERTWQDGVRDALKIVRGRQAHYELYREGKNTMITTHPAVFGSLQEIEISLAAMLERGEYRSGTVVDSGKPDADV